MIKKKYANCEQYFECSESYSCWCNDIKGEIVTNNDFDCFCPDCLEGLGII